MGDMLEEVAVKDRDTANKREREEKVKQECEVSFVPGVFLVKKKSALFSL